MHRPDAGGMADMRAFRRRRLAIVGLLVLLVAGAVAAVVLASGSDSGGGSTAAAEAPFDGTVYIESNGTKPGTNSVLAYRYGAGSFRPLSVREYPTGGNGIHDLTDGGSLDAEDQIATNADQTLLFAVNAGSDTVAVFNIADDGTLTPVKGSPFPSGGKAPASVGVNGDTLFVVNKAHDESRHLEADNPTYASFHIAADGTLTPIGTPFDVPPKSSPTQAYVVPGTNLLVGSEESGRWRTFTIGGDGSLTQAQGSPHPLDHSVRASGPSLKAWPQGISRHPTQKLLYAGVANLRKLVVYGFDDSGRLSLVNQQIDKGSVLPCWTVMNAKGTRLYTGNAGSQNISVYDVGTDPRKPRQIQSVLLKTPGNPWNFRIDPTGRYLFMVNMRAISAVPPGTGNTLHSFSIDAGGKLKEMPGSPVQIPVPLKTNPWGMVVVPRR
jgi:6-phosphogluconolactonase (cycloisomerase 2 family)